MTWIVRLGEFIKVYGGSDLPSQLFTKVAKRRVWWCFDGLIDKCVASSQDLFLSNFLDTNWTSVQTELPASAFTSRPILAVVLIRRSRREGITLINEVTAGSDMTDRGWDVAVKVENIDSENKNQSRKPKRGTMLFWVSGFSPPPPSLGVCCGICPTWKHIALPRTRGPCRLGIGVFRAAPSVGVQESAWRQIKGASLRAGVRSVGQAGSFVSADDRSARRSRASCLSANTAGITAGRGHGNDLVSPFDLLLVVGDGCMAGRNISGQII